jgi:peptide/nickel transport system substrate-binding protein
VFLKKAIEPEDQEGSTPQQRNQVVLHDIFRLQQMQISSFDPLDAYHAGHILIVKQLYSTLLDIDVEGTPAASLAKSWKTDDGKTWSFRLRDDVSFAECACFGNKSDRRLTASDVKYTFERLLSKDSTSLGISYFSNIVGVSDYRNGSTEKLNGIETVDDDTIVFHLEEQDYSFPILLTLPYASIVKKAAVQFYGKDFGLNPIGTGPFVLESYEPDVKIILNKNPHYWDTMEQQQLPFLSTVVVHLTSDDNLALLMFRDKRTDFLELSLPMFKQIEAMKIPFEYEILIQENPQLNFFLFNLDTIKDKRTRTAISRAIDRGKLQKILADQGNVAKGLYPQSIFQHLVSNEDLLAGDPADATSLPGSAKKLRLVGFDDILSTSVSAFIANELKEHGIEVQIESVPFPVLVDRLGQGKYDMIQIYWGPLYAEACHYLNPFLTSSFPPTGNNFNKYSNPEFDTLVQQTKSLSGDNRREKLLAAERIILDDMPFVLLYFRNTVRVSNRRFEMPLHPLQYRFYEYTKGL